MSGLHWENGRSGGAGFGSSRLDRELLDPGYGLLREDYFNAMLCQERKRSERSLEPIILLEMTGSSLSTDQGGNPLLRTVLTTLLSSIREVDRCGWLQQGSSVGVLFTGFSRDSVVSSRESIVDKIIGALRRNLSGKELQELWISIHVFPECLDRGKSTDNVDREFYPDLARQSGRRAVMEVAKRGVDILGSLFGLALFAPLMAVIVLLVRIDSPGPVLFRQQRVGRFGRSFTFLKFRSMYHRSSDLAHRRFVTGFIRGTMAAVPNNGEGQPVFKLIDDPRITPVGRWLRKTSMDELPQFFNVLRGDMSLVGPRPPIPYEFAEYDAWHRNRTLAVRPGITGLWQVSGRSSTSFDVMARMDIKYVREWSLWMDLKILLRTPMAVLSRKGAY